MNIVLLGAPGSGKGTQAELIVNKFNLYHLQTGDLARRLAKKDERLKKIVDSGQLIPHEEMTMHVINFLSKERADLKDILFEGFPRFIPQYEALKEFLKNKGDDIDLVLSLDISEPEVFKRVSSRRICEDCGEIYNLITNPPKDDKCKCGGKLMQREDDKPEAIKTRLEYYRENTKELIDHLDEKKELVRINGERPVEEIFDEIVIVIKKL